jgi:alpha-D-xyloside xylohydrolase
MPIFIRAGAVIPFGPQIQYALQASDEPLTIAVYTGENGNFRIYEDEGINYNYEKGAFSSIPLVYDEALKILTIGKREGAYTGMAQIRKFRVVFISKAKQLGYESVFSGGKLLEYNGEAINVNM